MIRLWRGLKNYRGDCAFETWVYRIAATCSLDFLRRKKRERTESIEPMREQGFDPPDDAPGTEEQVLNADRHARIRAAIAALPEEYRRVVLLRESEQLSYAEITEITGVELGTVKSRISRERKLLRNFLAASGNFFTGGASKDTECNQDCNQKEGSAK
jgi:RNA polymerase sigma-70 factor (ECF subfamily)